MALLLASAFEGYLTKMWGSKSTGDLLQSSTTNHPTFYVIILVVFDFGTHDFNDIKFSAWVYEIYLRLLTNHLRGGLYCWEDGSKNIP